MCWGGVCCVLDYLRRPTYFIHFLFCLIIYYFFLRPVFLTLLQFFLDINRAAPTNNAATAAAKVIRNSEKIKEGKAWSA